MTVGRAGWRLPAGLSTGVVLAHLVFFYALPAWPVLLSLLLVLLFQRSWLLAAVCLGLAWASLILQGRLADRLDPALNGSTLMIEGRVLGLPVHGPEFTRFRFQPLAGPLAIALPSQLLTYWYRDAPLLQPGETWRLELRLRPPWGPVNFHGSDRERWLFAEGVGGLATVRSGTRLQAAHWLRSGWDGWRQAARSHIDLAVADERNRNIVSALAIADSSGMSTQDRNILAVTGTAHLMAISGLHIGLAAWFGFWLARLLLLAIPLRWAAGQTHALALAAGLLLAVVYAGLAGFGTATLRALLMLAAGVLVLLTRRQVHPGQALLLALAGVFMFDPPAILGAGFWLSFSAVGVLLFIFAGGGAARLGRWRGLLLAQLAIMLALMPLSAWWFQQVSVSGLVVNLLAIPWVSMVVVPLVLLGLILLPLADGLGALAFTLAGHASGGLLQGLDLAAGLPHASLTLHQPSLWQLGIASLGALLLLLPRGLPHRWLGLPLLLPLFMASPSPPENQLRLDILDVGQGTALLVNSSRHLLVYDSGPGDGVEFDLVRQVILPAIVHSGHRTPDRIVISHGDLDHAGGMRRLLQTYPAAVVHGNLPRPVAGVRPCHDALRWEWDGIGFQVLHPSSHLPYLGNDSSCVLSIGTGNYSVLLPGDVTEAVESRLVKTGLAGGGMLLVPHHGSKTSSSSAFLRALQPSIAVATAGVGNRFGFPRPEVRQRYRDAGITFWSTDECGGIRLLIDGDGRVHAQSARVVKSAPWRWPAGASCP